MFLSNRRGVVNIQHSSCVWSAEAKQTLLGRVTVLLQEIRMWRSKTTGSSINTDWQGNHRNIRGSAVRLTTKPLHCTPPPPPLPHKLRVAVWSPSLLGLVSHCDMLVCSPEGMVLIGWSRSRRLLMTWQARGPGWPQSGACCWTLSVSWGTLRTLVWMLFNCYPSKCRMKKFHSGVNPSRWAYICAFCYWYLSVSFYAGSNTYELKAHDQKVHHYKCKMAEYFINYAKVLYRIY